MSKEERKVPELRFKGFHDDWEQRKLSNIAKLNPKSTIPQTFKYIDLESVKGNSILSYTEVSACSAPSRAQRLASKGDIFFQTVRPYQRNNFLYNLDDNDYVFSTGYAQIRPSISSYFLIYRLQEDSFVNKVLRSSTGTSYPAINSQDLSKINFGIPISEIEQDKIGSFLERVNKISLLHQRKINILEALKIAYLNVIFPNKYDNTPILRFRTFNEEWEKREFFENIKNVIDFRGRTPKKLDMEWSDNGYLALSALNVKNGFIDKTVDAKYGSEELYQKWMSGNPLSRGLVLFTTEAPMGNVALVPDDDGYILSQRTIALDTHKEKMTNLFLATILRTPLVINNLISLSSGATAKGISQKSLRALDIIVPTKLREQERIGCFVDMLDNMINLHQSKLHTLKRMKQVYLNKMFI